MRSHRAVALFVVLCTPACAFGEVDLTDKHCPCADGYVCDPTTNLCVEMAAPDAAAMDSGVSSDTGTASDGGRSDGRWSLDTSTSDSTVPTDTGSPADAGPADTGSPADTGVPPDTSTPPTDTTCDGPLGAYDWCDGFEMTGFGRYDDSFSGSGSSDRVTSPTYRGVGAYHAHTTRSDGYSLHSVRALAPSSGDSISFRMYVNVPSGFSISGFDFFAFSTVYDGGDLISFGVAAGGRSNVYSEPIDMDFAGPTSTPFPRDAWVCVQGRVDIGTAGGIWMAWDGVTVTDEMGIGTQPGAGASHRYIAFGLPWTDTDQEPVTIYIDELVADDTMSIPCD